MQIDQFFFTAAKATGDGATDPAAQCIQLWNCQTGTVVRTFKQNSCDSNAMCIAKAADGSPLIFACQSNATSVINVWHISKENPVQKLITNLNLSAIAVSPHANILQILAVGTKNGAICLWDLSSGNLLVHFEGHFAQITCLRFTADGCCLVSASADGAVHVWFVDALVRSNVSAGTRLKPTRFWLDHSDAVTDVQLTSDAWRNVVIVTASRDGFVHVYSMAEDRRILSVKCGVPVTCCALDSMRRTLFIGCETGEVMHVTLNSATRAQIVHSNLILGTTTDEAEGTSANHMKHHSAPIAALCHSSDEFLLAAACADGSVSVWDTCTFQLKKIHSLHRAMPVTAIATDFMNCDLAAYAAAGSKFKPFPMLKRTARLQEESLLVSLSAAAAAADPYSERAMLRATADAPHSSLQSTQQMAALRSRYSQLQNDHARLTKLYDDLYKFTLESMQQQN